MRKKIIISGVLMFTILAISIGLFYFISKSADVGTTLVDGLIPESEFNDKGHISRDKNAQTDEFSLMYNNKDGSKSLYVFASPVQFLKDDKYQLIDNTLVNSSDGYLFENKNNDLHTYYPNMKEKDSFLMKYSDKAVSMQAINNSDVINKIQSKTVFDMKQEMVEYYKDKKISVSYFTTNLGLKCQITINKPIPNMDFDFNLSSDLKLDDSNEKYFLYKDGLNKNATILYQPIAVDSNGNLLSETAKISIMSNEKDVSKMKLSITPQSDKKQYPITVEFTLNMYKGNQVDSSIQSRIPNNNQYLDNYLHVGKDYSLGEAESYVRFETDIMDKYISDNDVKSITYNCYGVGKEQKKLSLYKCDSHWTSTKITWNTKQRFETKLTDFLSIQEHSYTADITELAKQWSRYPVLKDNGFMLKTEDEIYQLIASADNGYMMPRLEILTYD